MSLSILPTDGEILDVVVVEGGRILPTYVIKNILRRRWPRVKTPWVLRRMKALEKAGKVRRTASSYATMICWAVATPAAQGSDGQLDDNDIDGDAAVPAYHGL